MRSMCSSDKSMCSSDLILVSLSEKETSIYTNELLPMCQTSTHKIASPESALCNAKSSQLPNLQSSGAFAGESPPLLQTKMFVCLDIIIIIVLQIYIFPHSKFSGTVLASHGSSHRPRRRRREKLRNLESFSPENQLRTKKNANSLTR